MRIRRDVVVVLGAMALMAGGASSASASYKSWGPLKAYESGTFVAEGKGIHGIDTEAGVFGGHMGTRDPRPGGSPVKTWIYGQWETNDTSSLWYSHQSPYNYTSSWKDTAKYTQLNFGYDRVEYYSEVCQVDDGAPDDCAATPHARQSF